MALTDGQRDALTAAVGDARAQIRDQLVEYSTRVWGSLGDYRDADIDGFVDRLVPRVQAGEQAVARVTDAYIATMDGAEQAGTFDLGQLRGGTTPDEVYRRPAVTMRTELAKGASFDEAVQAGAGRLVQLVTTDLQLAHTRQAQHSMSPRGRSRSRRVTGRYARVPKVKACALCLIASTQWYSRNNLLPIHPGCGCTVRPLTAAEYAAAAADGHGTFDREFLDQVHASIEQQFPGGASRSGRDVEDYRKLIAVREHGEYGPTLTWQRHGFTSPAQLRAAGTIAGEAADLPGTVPVLGDVVEAAAAPRPSMVDLFDDLEGWGDEDVLDTLELAQDSQDQAAVAVLEREWQRRLWEASKGASAKLSVRDLFTREQLREMYAGYVEDQYVRADAATNGNILNKKGRARRIDARSLFSGDERHARRYASEDLLWFWNEPGNQRLTFNAFAGDSEALYKARRSTEF